MIKILLKNNTQIEFDSPKEASQLLHSLYWREFQQKDEVKEMGKLVLKKCRYCNNAVGFHRSLLCGGKECIQKNSASLARRYWKKRRTLGESKVSVPVNISSPFIST